MNARKHLAGFILFSFILGSAIFINYSLTLPDASISPIPMQPLTPGAIKGANFSYKVRQVSLDFAGAKSYTALSMRLRSGQPAPEAIWVKTYYYSPALPGSMWSTTSVIREPFAAGDEVEVVATDALNRGSFPKTPKVGYFAKVHVSTWPSDENFSLDISAGLPVVVHWPRQ